MDIYYSQMSIHPYREGDLFYLYSSIAQSVERMTVNHDVTGSSPVRGAKDLHESVSPFFMLPNFTGSNQWHQTEQSLFGLGIRINRNIVL